MDNKIKNPLGIPFLGLVLIDLLFLGLTFPAFTVRGLQFLFFINALAFLFIAFLGYKHYKIGSNGLNLFIVKFTPLGIMWSNIFYAVVLIALVFMMG